MNNKLQRLRELHAEAFEGGGEKRIAKQQKGKLTARERIHFLLDEGSFEEIGDVCHPSNDGFWYGSSENSG